MKVIKQKFITREDLKNNRDKAYLFGDNLMHTGFGGQAKEMRGEPNAIGVPTKRLPSQYPDSYFGDGDFEIARVEIDMALELVKGYKVVVIPEDGLGTGLAQLPERAPRIYQYLLKKLEDLGDS